MNLRKRLATVIVGVMAGLFLLQACSLDPEGNYFRGRTSPARSSETPVQSDTVDETPTPSAKPAATPTEPPYTGKLDTAKLSALDNTKQSWWIRLNDTHDTPGTDQSALDALSAHAGIFTGDTGSKTIYLTFDEGYENGYTAQILDALKTNGVKAAFFVTLSYLQNNPELVDRMVNEGHVVGNHSVSHLSLPDLTYSAIENELNGVDEAFYARYGKHMKYFRPPMGEYSARTLEAAKQLGYKSVFWSFAYNDWDVNNQKGADNAYNVVMANWHNGAVYLLHAVSSDNAGALDRMIKALKAEGFALKPLDI